jgi:Phosphate-selective porin O and P
LNHNPMMKILLPLLVFSIFCNGQATWAQDSTQAPAQKGLGNGLRFEVNEGAYRFKISGMLQPSYQYTQTEGLPREQKLFTKRSYLNFGGEAIKEKVSFFVQADFTAATPLLDAWVAYHFSPRWKLAAGQMRTFTNNREMTFDEDKLQFAERSILSQTFQTTGREFGLFLQGKIGKRVILEPQFALTSGDGANSFGASSLDVDQGGVKVGYRLDIYPLGEFSADNRGFSADLKHEEKPKILIGVAGSFNKGASNAKGEGHGDFALYGSDKKIKLPDLRKFSGDFLLKYQGFSLLFEFMNTSASVLSGTYIDSSASLVSILRPSQISQFLLLGNAWNLQAGYVTRSGYAFDVRHENLRPEFATNVASLLQDASVSTLGLSKYFNDNKLKIQLSASQVKYQRGGKSDRAEVMVQVVF